MPNPFKTARFTGGATGGGMAGGTAGAALGAKPMVKAPGGIGSGTMVPQDMRITNPGSRRSMGPSAENLKMQNAAQVRNMFNPRLAESTGSAYNAPGTKPSGIIRENNKKIAAMAPGRKPVAAKQPMPAKRKSGTPLSYRTVTDYTSTGDVVQLSRTPLAPKLQSKTGQIPK